MKKIMMTLALALTLSSMYAFTGEEAVNKHALAAFKSEFNSAKDVDWTVAKDYYRVNFTMNDQKLFAYYTMNGEFMAVSRYISSFQMPLNLQTNLKKSFSKYWITDLFELANQDGTSYYVTLETADTRLVLKSTDGNNWTLYQKTQKA